MNKAWVHGMMPSAHLPVCGNRLRSPPSGTDSLSAGFFAGEQTRSVSLVRVLIKQVLAGLAARLASVAAVLGGTP